MTRPRHASLFLLVCALTTPAALSQSTARVSLGISGEGNLEAHRTALSANGGLVAFSSLASNLVAGDTNTFYDVFVRDLVANSTTRVSVSTGGAEADGQSDSPTLSADGRFVAFGSFATTLAPGILPGVANIFVRDLQTGQTSLVSAGFSASVANGNSFVPAISGDGRFVAFQSFATNLVPGDTGGFTDIFVRDLTSASTARVSVDSAGVQGNNNSISPAISADGRFVAFQSRATNLVPGDTNGVADIFVRDRVSGSTERVSVDSSGAQAATDSFTPALSGDGRFVAFVSDAVLDAGDTNANLDVFVHDRQTGQTTRVSVATSGTQANGPSTAPAFSADGRCVAFASNASNLVAADSNVHVDVFVHDLVTGVTSLASVAASGLQGNGDSASPALSSDGSRLAFESVSTNMVTGDTNAVSDVFLRLRSNPSFAFCFGDGSRTPCPCGNSGFPGNGCDNSAGTAGALLVVSGAPLPDSIVLTSIGELPSSISIFLQGDVELGSGAPFGDGVRCIGGSLKRLYAKNASGGTVSAPESGDLSIRERSAALGDAFGTGTSRSYQVYYRDPAASFCSAPTGDTWNVSSAIHIDW